MSDRNVADDNTDVVNRLFAQAKEDAGESFPEWAGARHLNLDSEIEEAK